MTPTRACRHLHTDGRPCGSPALCGEPFCFHHHISRKPMPKRPDLNADPRDGLLTPQLPAPDDFPAIQRALGEVLRLLTNGRLTDTRAATLLKGLAVASQNLARQHRREEKLAALGLLAPQVTDFVNHPQYGTLAPEAASEKDTLETDNLPLTTDQPGCPTFATVSPSLRWVSTEPLPDPIPVFTPDPSPQTSYDEGKTVEINNYFQDIDDKRRAQSAAWLAQREEELERELEARYDDRLREFKTDYQARLEALLQVRSEALIPIPIQQNQDLRIERENTLALAS